MSRNATVKNPLHYHVLSGDHGYMPTTNDVYRTKAEAQAAATASAQDLRWEGYRVDGRMANGYYEVCECAGLEYIEVTTCTELGCLADLDD